MDSRLYSGICAKMAWIPGYNTYNNKLGLTQPVRLLICILVAEMVDY